MNNNGNIIHRYKIASGHLKKVIKMIEEGVYCVDIVHQSLAVQAALKKADQLVLKNHLETCVSESIKKGEGKKAIAEIMEVLEKT
ncbi:MAG TPA: metal-sensitive transcriptional regulator [Patescibacteria group bacterium]|nr:metal-sensitive transcriptional regulator [Patescibacteria group bacterium]